MENENSRTGIQQLRYSYPFYDKILEDKNWKIRNIIPTKCSLKKEQEKQEIFQEKEIGHFWQLDDEDWDHGYTGKKFVSTTVCRDIPRINVPLSRHCSSK